MTFQGKTYTNAFPFNGLRRLEIVFIFPRLVLQILFQLQFGLSYQCEIYHRHKWNVTEYFFQKTCYHGNDIMHSVAPPKSKAIVLLRERIGEIFSNSYITCCWEWSSKYVTLKKFCRIEESKNLIFDYCFLNFLKVGIDTHSIDLSCHQKFEKNSPIGSENISARSWKIWKSHGRLDPTLRMREVVHARSIKFLRVETAGFHPDVFFVTRRYFFLTIVLRVTRKVTKTNLGELYCWHLH